jgi:DNA gyrase subunit A
VTRTGAIKALPSDTFVPKGKNGNATYTSVRGDEQLRQIIATTSQDYLLCIASTGRVFQIATHRIPVGNRSAKGEPIRKILDMHTGEEIVSVLPIETYDEDRYLVTFSKLGKVKKSPLSEYKTADVDGLLDMKLAESDSIVAALLSKGQGEYLVSTDNGQTLRFSDESLRAQGRVGQGVAAMTLAPKASVVSASYVDSEQAVAQDVSLLVVTENSFIKKVPVSQFPQKGRATGGVSTTDLLEKDHVLLTTLVNENDILLFTWIGETGDTVTVTKAREIKTFPRAKRGLPLFDGRMVGVVKL